MSSFHNGKVEYCAIFGSGDIEENANVNFFTQTLFKQYTIIHITEGSSSKGLRSC